MKLTSILFVLFVLLRIQLQAQSPLPVFAGNAESHKAKSEHFSTLRNFPDTLSLPFIEDWESGSFATNFWQTGCANWEVEHAIGNPGKSAEFDREPLINNYSCALITPSLDASEISDGNVFINFDLKIDDRYDTVETEKIILEVFTGSTWYTLDSIVARGDIDWQEYEYDISEWAKGFVFQIGFFAEGESSLNIDGWYLDNINIERVCKEPSSLCSEIIYESTEYAVIEINWLPPGATYGWWESYHDGTFEDAIASDEGGAGLAQRFSVYEYPYTIKEIRYFNSSYGQHMQECEIWVLTGDGANVLSGPYYIENATADSWVTVDVDDVHIESGSFMIATFNVNADGPYVGVDDSYYDASLYIGSIGDFTELGELGYFYVGSHEAYIESERDGIPTNAILSSNGTKDHRDLIGYNIWSNDVLIAETWPETNFYDTMDEFNTYCYYISAVYDQCESDTLGYVCEDLFIGPPPGITEINLYESINIFPNPGSQIVSIQTDYKGIVVFGASIFNSSGQLIKQVKFIESNRQIDISSFPEGVFFITLKTNKGSITKKLLKD